MRDELWWNINKRWTLLLYEKNIQRLRIRTISKPVTREEVCDVTPHRICIAFYCTQLIVSKLHAFFFALYYIKSLLRSTFRKMCPSKTNFPINVGKWPLNIDSQIHALSNFNYAQNNWTIWKKNTRTLVISIIIDKC